MPENLTFAIKTLIWKWLQLCATLCRCTGWNKRCHEQSSLVLVPCEPGHVIGSRGDEAMVYAILADYRRRHSDGRITVIVNNVSFKDSPDGRRLAKDFPGIECCPAWIGHSHLSRIYKTFICHKATEVHVVGADCMDGYYESAISFTLLASADLATRMGIKTKLTGFSFNEHPTKPAKRMFRHVTRRLVCNVRDPVSLERVKSLGYKNVTTQLVADVAFMLNPVESDVVATIVAWIQGERARGRTILAFNLHGMLVGRSEYDKLVDDAAAGLGRFLGENERVSVVLVPNDYRPQGDIDALTKIAKQLGSNRIRLVSEVLSAAELKGLMGHVDCLFTSRMHLGIAALGMGKPIAVFAYQGKFAGLFEHFGLLGEFVLSPDRVKELPELLRKFIAAIEDLTRKVKSRLADMLELSSKNLIQASE